MLRLACWIAVLAAMVAFSPRRTELATARALYLEDAPVPRPIAAVKAAVVRSGGDVRLEVVVSPRGDGVEPLPGFAGVPGTNLRTAEELERLWREDAMQLVTRESGRSITGEPPAVTWATLPARSVSLDGALIATATRGSLPLAVVFRSAPLRDGTSDCYLEADGVPRLFVQVVRDGGTARIAAIESVGAPMAAPGAAR